MIAGRRWQPTRMITMVHGGEGRFHELCTCHRVSPSSPFISRRVYRISSELRSQAASSFLSTGVGDHPGIGGNGDFILFCLLPALSSAAGGRLPAPTHGRVAASADRWVALRKLRCEPHVCDTHTRQQSWSEVQVECSGGRRTHIGRWATLAAYTHDHDGRGAGSMSYVRVTGCHPRRRSYHAEYTGSHPNSEVKLRRASLVLGWGTTRESGVTATSFFCFCWRCAALCCVPPCAHFLGRRSL